MVLRPNPRFRRLLYDGLRNETLERANTSCMVIAPHQDDEILGCGGTMILKRQSGASVTVAFMTDGSNSHRQFMSEDKLRAMRKTEAINAAEVIGVASDDVHFLDFPDGKLERFHADAVKSVLSLIERYHPQEIYAPYRFDRVRDHECTNEIVVEAVEKACRPLELCEYPIWFWNRWPWVPLELRYNRDTVHALTRFLWEGFGRRNIKEFQCGVFIGDVLERKREALSRHRSQMTKVISWTDWPTLPEVSEGEFLQCFFQEFEVFRCRKLFRYISNYSP